MRLDYERRIAQVIAEKDEVIEEERALRKIAEGKGFVTFAMFKVLIDNQTWVTGYSQASLRKIQLNITRDLPDLVDAVLNALSDQALPPDEDIEARFEALASLTIAFDANSKLRGMSLLEAVRAMEAGTLNVTERDAARVGRAIVEAASRACFGAREEVRLWFELCGAQPKLADDPKSGMSSKTKKSNAKSKSKTKPPVAETGKQLQHGMSLLWGAPSMVDGLIIFDATTGDMSSPLDGFEPTMLDVNGLGVPIEFKTPESFAKDKYLFRSVAQVLSWLAFSNGTRAWVAGGGSAYGIVSSGLTFRLVVMSLRLDIDLKAQVDPSDETPNFRRIYDLGVSEPVTFTAADFQEGAEPPGGFKQLCRMLLYARGGSTRAAAEPRDLSQRPCPPLPITVASPERGPAEVLLIESVSWSRRGLVMRGELEGAPVTATLTSAAHAAQETQMLQRVQAAGACRYVPRVLAHGRWTTDDLQFGASSHAVITDTVGVTLGSVGVLLAPQDVAHMVHDIGAALLALERAGLAHRDVKPDNIVWSVDLAARGAASPGYTGDMTLVDFDLAEELEQAASEEPDPLNVSGTAAFASTPALCGFAPHASDDWESLLYSALDRLRGPAGDGFRAWRGKMAPAAMGADMARMREALMARLALARPALADGVARAHRDRFEAAVSRAERLVRAFDKEAEEDLADARRTSHMLEAAAQLALRDWESRRKRD